MYFLLDFSADQYNAKNRVYFIVNDDYMIDHECKVLEYYSTTTQLVCSTR